MLTGLSFGPPLHERKKLAEIASRIVPLRLELKRCMFPLFSSDSQILYRNIIRVILRASPGEILHGNGLLRIDAIDQRMNLCNFMIIW